MLKRRAPLGSFTDAWRACAPEAATSSTVCDGPAHMHAFFFLSRSTRLETRIKELGSSFVGAKPASALNALAWTSAQATDCDLKSRSRKSISVWVSLSSLSLSCSPLPLLSVFSLPPFLSALFSLFLPLSLSLSFFPHHHHLHLHFHSSSSYIHLPCFAFFVFLSRVFICYASSDKNLSCSCSSMQFSCHLGLQWTRKRSTSRSYL